MAGVRVCASRRLAYAALVSACIICSAFAFNEKEFKKCKDSGFCRRNRGRIGPVFSVVPDSMSVEGGLATFSLLHPAANKHLALSLTVYKDGFIRFFVDEPDAKRFQVADIVLASVAERQGKWTNVAQDGTKSATLVASNATAVLQYEPFKLTISIADKPAVVVNSRGLFNWEHRRTKEEETDIEACDACWEETFKGHQDSKPKGPESLSMDISFPGFDHVYGIPLHAASHRLKPTLGEFQSEPYRLYNLDVFEYAIHSPFGLYGTIPYMIAHRPGLTTGVFWLNAAEMYVDVKKGSDGTETQWWAESGVIDLYVFTGPTPKDVMKQYASLTGTTAMPQLFGLGYHQCRWNYKDEAEVKEVDSGFDEHAIPYDVMWLDIEHTNGKRYLTWDSNFFPNPIDMQNNLATNGRKLVTIVDPHVKRDPTYYIHNEAEAAKYYVRNRNQGVFDGWCWPGSSSYLDVTNPAVRNWWAQQFTTDRYNGSTPHLYIWNDMNEPSVFNGPEITMLKDNIHHGEFEHRDVHNLYGIFYHMATADGLDVRGRKEFGEDGDRPFVLSRAFYAGTQRVGPIWTGDNQASWEHMRISLPMLMTLGVTGLPFSGADVGGFFGAPEPELLSRWYQLGAFYPFFRGHSHLEAPRREPYMLGEPYTTRFRDAINERYSLMPYIYTLFRHANLSGTPVVGPTWYEFPENKETFDLDEQMMLGPAILVRPVMEAGVTSVEVTMPRVSRWYDQLTGQEFEKSTWLPGREEVFKVKVDQEHIPAFYRGGYIVPRRERPRRSTATQLNDPVTLVVSLDYSQQASGDLYMDDGHSYAFKRGQYLHRTFKFEYSKLSSNATATDPTQAVGVLELPEVVVERVVFLGLPKKSTFKAKLPGGKTVALETGPLSQRAPSSTHCHVLRNPGLPISQDWVVEVIKA